MKRFGWVALGFIVACGGGGEVAPDPEPLPSQPLTPESPDGGAPTLPGDPTIPTVPPTTETPMGDGGGGSTPTPIDPPVKIAECQNSVTATLLTQAEEPVLEDGSADGQTVEFTSARDGTVVFEKSSGQKSDLPSYELLGLVLDGSIALVSDINYPSGSQLYTLNAKTGVKHEIAIGELAFSVPMLTADKKVGVFAFTSGRVLAHNFQTQRTTVLANDFPTEFDYANPPIHQSEDSGAFLLQDGSRWLHYDAGSSTSTPLAGASEGRFIGTGRRYYYQAAGRLAGREGAGATVDLGPYAPPTATGCGSVSAESNVLLVVGTDGVGRLWRPGDALPITVGTGLCRGVLSHGGAHAALTRGQASGPNTLVVRNLSSGVEKQITTDPSLIEAVPSSSGGRVAVKTSQAGGSGSTTRVRLFDVATGLEIPLTPAMSADGPIDVAFKDSDRVLSAVPAQSALAVYDTLTGIQKYRTARSVISGEGQLAIWNSTDTALFTPVDWYLSDVYAHLYAFQLGSGKETAIGDETIIDCQVGNRTAIRRKMVDPQDTSLPGELVVFNAGDSGLSIASQAAEQPVCTTDRMVYRDRPTAVRNQHIEEGRLWSVNLAAGTKTLVAEGTTSFVVRGKQLLYTTKKGVCAAQLP